jgi:fructooligosaccharide transport system permease protein
LFVVPLQTGTALLLALLINKKVLGVNFFRTIFYSPVVLSMVVVSILWALLYNRNAGLINAMLGWFGLPPQPFLESVAQAMPCITVMSVWQGAGYQMVIFLAGLQGIAPSLYEAANIDGANRWQQFRHITLPGLYNVTVFVVMVTSIFAFGLFTQPYIMTQGGPEDSTRTLIMMFFEEGFRTGEVGTGTAIVVLYFLIVLVMTLLQKKIAGERTDMVL